MGHGVKSDVFDNINRKFNKYMPDGNRHKIFEYDVSPSH